MPDFLHRRNCMRLRRKPWIDQAILEYKNFLFLHPDETLAGHWEEQFGRQAPLHVELGTGKGRFISSMGAMHPDVDYVGLERQEGVIYYAGQKTAAVDPPVQNVRLALWDIGAVGILFAPGEVDRFYINFCDPWPKARHAKRRLTHRNYLERYRTLLSADGDICFKTDNRELFDFSVQEFTDMGWALFDVTADLHSHPADGDVMTEYEEKFSEKGNLICRLIAKPPSSKN